MPDDDAKAAWIKNVLGIDVSGTSEDGAPELDDDALRKLLMQMLRDTLALAASLPPAVKLEVAQMAKDARALIDGPDLLAAEIAVERLQAFRDDAAQQARLDDAAAVGQGVVQYRKLWFEWRAAQSESRAALDRLADAVINDQEMQASPLYEDVLEAAGSLGDLFPPFEGALETVLQQLEEAPDTQTAEKLRQEALKHLQTCDAMLQQADGLERMQRFADQEYGGFEPFRRLRTTLDDLRKRLGG